MKDIIIAILYVIAAVGIGLAFISAIGYTIYLWSHSMSFPESLWEGFILWIKFMGTGLVALVFAKTLDS